MDSSTRYKIAFLCVFSPGALARIKTQLPEGFDLAVISSYDDAERAGALSGADFVVFGGPARLTGELMDLAPGLKLIQKWGAGLDKIDLEIARRRGIPVAITAGGNAVPVAEHAVMLMLSVFRRLPYVDRSLRQGRWLQWDMTEIGYQLTGKTVGIVGLGYIGKEVARRLQGFNCRILYHNRTRVIPAVEEQLGVEYRTLDELIAQADIVSLHVPLSPATRGLIDARRLSLMKPTAILINCARGGVVDEPALVEALTSGKILGAGLDVFAEEPIRLPNPLCQMDNVVLTPHSGDAVIDNMVSMARHAFGNILRVARGEPLPEADLIRIPPAV